ncbi:flagellar hook protein FlgK [Shewanella mangrovi]|uniref:Flagellar hook-associated protein 1 n=1 Tax=Shewanella mangrovi TaxID=1515746 RepID=A0A094JCH2_9GAMM|nr:flagellar hook-associated protein FlgK [Shewanella mangrovi]KFZ36912.1 flagellar hook protein FlgK [Shewanella mangrovi]
MAIDLLSIARTGVLAAQSQLGVTSNNISNVNTEGYNRQVANQVTDNSYYLGGNYYGTGTYVNDVKRIYNEFAAREMRSSQTALSAAETTHDKLSQLDELFSKVGIAVPSSLNDFYASLNSLADLPDDAGIRQNVLTSANQLATSLNQMDGYLDSQMSQTNDEISSIATRINEISTEVANINRELQKNQGVDPQLLDKQDKLIQELSQYAEVNVVPLDNGGRSVMFGSSFMLVSGEQAMTLGTQEGQPYPTEPDLTYTLGNTTLKVDASKIGGQLGALFDYRENILQPANQQLGQLALGVADAFNSQQAQGLDLNGNVGANIFTDINDPTFASSRLAAFTSNNGSANLSVDLTDVGALTGNSYQLRYDGTAYQLTNLQTGMVDSTLTLNGNTLEGADGFVINIDNPALMAAGDRFEIRPTGNAAQQIKVEMTDPKGIAAAGAYTADAANSANTAISMVSVDNRNAATFPEYGSELTYIIDSSGAPITYQAVDANGTTVSTGSAAGTPPQISDNGFTFQLDSVSGGTDRFTFDLSAASGDNTNVLAMAKLSENKMMNGGKATLADVYEQTKLGVGSDTKAAETRVNSAQSIYDQAYTRVQSESGVNLDEEAANLLKFQQAYQASARVMTTANTIFDTLFNAVR